MPKTGLLVGLRRLMLAAILALAATRCALFCVSAWTELDSIGEAYFLEAGMTHRCWRVQSGLSLYPDYRDMPYNANFFTPGYFLAVGYAGRILGADLDRLMLLGRSVSFGCMLLGAGLAAAVVRNRGRFAMITAALFAIGGAPALGFGYAVRPDLLADLLGVVGLILSMSAANVGLWLSPMALAAACFVKQTAAIYLLAAGLALTFQKRTPVALAVVAASCLAFAVAGQTYSIVMAEPRFWNDIFGERLLPWSVGHWLKALRKTALAGPEMILLLVAGTWGAARGEKKDWMAWFAVAFLASTLLAMKVGSDWNYFLPWRIPAAVIAGTLAASASTRNWFLILLLGSMTYSAAAHATFAASSTAERAILDAPGGLLAETVQRLRQAVEDPNRRVLTDVGMLILRQKNRAAYVDPWLFRQLVLAGVVRPDNLRVRIEARQLDLLILNADLDDPRHEALPFALPPELADAARRNYVLVAREAAWFVYAPKR